MISLHAGRLLLFCDRADRTWHCRVVLGPKPEHQVEADTGAIQLQDALLRAQSIYSAAVARIRPVTEPRLLLGLRAVGPSTATLQLGLP